jgi:hypothetical protein
MIWAQFEIDLDDGTRLLVGPDVAPDGNCNLSSMHASSPDHKLPGAVEMRGAVHAFGASSAGRPLGEQLFQLLIVGSEGAPPTFDVYWADISRNGRWTGNVEHVMASVLFGVCVIAVSNTGSPRTVMDSRAFLLAHCPAEFHISSAAPSVYVFHHLYGNPHLQRPAKYLNHFCPAMLVGMVGTSDRVEVKMKTIDMTVESPPAPRRSLRRRGLEVNLLSKPVVKVKDVQPVVKVQAKPVIKTQVKPTAANVQSNPVVKTQVVQAKPVIKTQVKPTAANVQSNPVVKTQVKSTAANVNSKQVVKIENEEEARDSVKGKRKLVQSTIGWDIKPKSRTIAVRAKKKAVHEPKAAKKKTQKQIKAHQQNSKVMTDWLKSAPTNALAVEQLENARRDYLRDEANRARAVAEQQTDHGQVGILVESLVIKVINQISMDDSRSRCPIKVVINTNRREQNWKGRALLVAFFLSPALGNQRADVYNAVFSETATLKTLLGWLRSVHVAKWLAIAKELTAGEIIEALPKAARHLFAGADLAAKLPQSVILRYERKQSMGGQQNSELVFNSGGSLSVQRRRSAAKAAGAVYVTNGMRRIASGSTTLGRKVKYPIAEAYVSDFIVRRWDRGDPASREQVLTAIRREYATDGSDFSALVASSERLRKWLTRLLVRMEFAERAYSIAQKVPDGWRDLAFADAAHIQTVVAMDETFVTYHTPATELIVPKGTNRVGSVLSIDNEKRGITLALGIDLQASRLLPPFVIDKGKFGSTLMKQWNNYSRSAVIFNETHWMTQYTFIIWLSYLMMLYPLLTRIGVIVDRSRTHFGPMIDEWLKTCPVTFTILFIGEGMTSVMQVGDLILNKPFKLAVKQRYQALRDQAIGNLSVRELATVRYCVPRDQLIGIIEDVADEINLQNVRHRWIAAGFDLAGQNPWSNDLSPFTAHLDSLETNAVYANLITNNKKLSLTD